VLGTLNTDGVGRKKCLSYNPNADAITGFFNLFIVIHNGA
jgi:hypothetical protein